MSEPFSFPLSWRWLDRPPLHLQTGLAGHVVVVLYWRLGCVHSRAALNEVVAAMADMHGQPVAVVAVHVPMSEAEGDEDRLRRVATQLKGPVTVAIEPDHSSLKSLPTVLLLDSDGSVRTRAVGIPRQEQLRTAIDMLLAEAASKGQVASVPYVPAAFSGGPRWSPSAIAADDDQIWVASARHRRVFALNTAGEVTMVVGSGDWGCADGPADEASFAQPVSLCIHDEYLVVADAQTHTLRAIDRHTGEVITWCGNGQLGVDDVGGGYGRDQALSSPASMVSRDGGLYVCMAGTDQLWQIDPMTGAAMAWLGGDVGDVGGDAFAEPLGLVDRDDCLWVTEARSHELAVVDLAHLERRTVHQTFRRPVAAVTHGDSVLVLDSWERAVFVVSAEEGTCQRLIGQEHGLLDPQGLAVAGDRLFVADAGVDALLVHDLSREVVPLLRWEVTGLPKPPKWREDAVARVAEELQLREFSDVTLHIPALGHTDGEEAVIDVVDESVAILACDRHEVVRVQSGEVAVLLPIADTGDGVLRIRMLLEGATACYLLPVTVSADGLVEATLVLPD